MSILIYTDHPTTNEAIEVWGDMAQLSILQEECAELIVAVSKLERNAPNAPQMMAEEIADVIVSMMSVIPMLSLEAGVEVAKTTKLARLARRTDKIKRDRMK